MEKNSNQNTIIFYAPIGNLIKGFKSGGAEAGCKKTMEVLKKNGYEIILLEKPARTSDSKLGGIVLLFKLLGIWLRLIGYFVKNREHKFHVAGFYLKQIYFEWLLIKTARLFNVKSIYEIRNGGMIEAFQSGGRNYQYFLKSTLLNSSLILCQGLDYVSFLKDNFNRNSVYYPNYIMDSFVGPNNIERGENSFIKLIYFGRVVPDKNVEFIIDVCYKLKQLNFNVTLDVIGSYEDKYYDLLSKRADSYGISENIKFHGRMDFAGIYEYLTSAHFFIFPSKEKREGHSNSLTEAMGCGVVPIASGAGFNASIIDDPSLIIQEYAPDSYALKISEIWTTGKWGYFSDKVYTRIRNNFVESVVEKSLIGGYNLLEKK